MKSSGLDANPYFDSKLEKGKHIIDVEPSVTIATTKFQPKEPKDLEEGTRCNILCRNKNI
jgi:hypothetical protein